MQNLLNVINNNSGQGSAHAITLNLTPNFQRFPGKYLSELGLFKHGIKHLAPRQRLTFFEKITRDEMEPLTQGIVALHKALAPAGDTACVFRDSAFADDVAKTNLAAILQQHGLAHVRSL
jgi:hypothetical protein